MVRLLVLLTSILSLHACKEKRTPAAEPDRPLPPKTESRTRQEPGSRGSNGAIPFSSQDPLIISGQLTGFYFLKDETLAIGSRTLIRREVKDCPSLVPRTNVGCPANRSQGAQCTVDHNCTEQPRGYCFHSGMVATCTCQYGCKMDSECAQNQICVCADPVGYCAASTCGANSICGAKKSCVATALPNDVVHHGPFRCVAEAELQPKPKSAEEDDH
jgi:hypothetical protein